MIPTALIRRQAKAANLSPLPRDAIPTHLRPTVDAWLDTLSPGCAHVERGQLGFGVMPKPRVMCPVHIALLDIDADHVHCSTCNRVITGAPGTVAGYIAPSASLWALVAFCPECAGVGER